MKKYTNKYYGIQHTREETNRFSKLLPPGSANFFCLLQSGVTNHKLQIVSNP